MFFYLMGIKQGQIGSFVHILLLQGYKLGTIVECRGITLEKTCVNAHIELWSFEKSPSHTTYIIPFKEMFILII